MFPHNVKLFLFRLISGISSLVILVIFQLFLLTFHEEETEVLVWQNLAVVRNAMYTSQSILMSHTSPQAQVSLPSLPPPPLSFVSTSNNAIQSTFSLLHLVMSTLDERRLRGAWWCDKCVALLSAPDVGIGQLFALLRQWTPCTQLQLDTIVMEILKRGAHVDDRDGMTDMTLLHYTAKSGALGNEELACSLKKLIKRFWSNCTSVLSPETE
ncbi:hypothetical protein ACTXT7_009362 [Hymenolepis weldensis]